MPEPTPEQVEEYQKQEAMHIAAAEAADDSMWTFIESMGPEELLILRGILKSIETPADKAKYDGILIAALRLTHKVCESCGVDHSAEAFSNLFQDHEGKVESKEYRTEQDDLDEYGVHYLSRSKSDKVVCNECGYENPSLKDRMARMPKANGCLGCQLKSEQG